MTKTTAVSVGSTDTKMTFNQVIQDGGIVDIANSRLVVPDGVKRVRLAGQVHFSTTGGGHTHGAKIVKNGATSTYYSGIPMSSADGDGPFLNFSSPTITVNTGDYFELYAYQGTGGAVTAHEYSTWIHMEVVD